MITDLLRRFLVTLIIAMAVGGVWLIGYLKAELDAGASYPWIDPDVIGERLKSIFTGGDATAMNRPPHRDGSPAGQPADT